MQRYSSSEGRAPKLDHLGGKTWERTKSRPKEEVYEEVKASYNAAPNGADLLYLCRSCYGGVVRFRQKDGVCPANPVVDVHGLIWPRAHLRAMSAE